MCERSKSNMINAGEETYWDLATFNCGNNNVWDGLFSPSNGQSFCSSSNDIFNDQKDKNLSQDVCNNKNNIIEKSSETKSMLEDSQLIDSVKVKTSPVNNWNQNDFFTNYPSSHHSSSVVSSAISTNKSINDNSVASNNIILGSDVTIHLDFERLKSEHRKLKKYFEIDYKNRFNPPSISEAVRRLCLCEPVSLDLYISKKDKFDLLDEGLQSYNWDVVVMIVLFLKRTLDNSIFRSALIERPDAAQYYVTYLRESGEYEELLYTLYGLGRIVEATMEEFKMACNHKDPIKQLRALQRCLLDGFQNPDLTTERRHLQEWISLLETHTKYA
ncbi:hypothetical protein Mgra_00007746 [Meloidogyne graminicola]|uniref:Uncharacterized protein n=1 Tax=Meloidogyne graminicola TaxID=189291 RepID=A0A8S9ZHT7_9BILA|nr:hypothetical protein Mgra_00007746 [Meloidogyne graminicola]